MVETLKKETRGVPMWWWVYAAVIGAFALAALLAGTWGILTNNRQDAEARAEERARDAQAARFDACIEEFAAAIALRSTEVSEAQEVVDATEERADTDAAARDAAFQVVLDLVLTEPPAGQAESLKAFRDLRDKNAALAESRANLVAAREALGDARKAHPVPEPPSSGTCLTD